MTNKNLTDVRALDASGSAWSASERVDTAGDVGLYCSMTEVAGQPGISYYDATNGDLKFSRYYY